jgi:NTE family protein
VFSKQLFLCLILALLLPLPAAAAGPPGPRVCLVLSGGGARGAAHIGILKILDREKIPIDLIVGTSAGALVGGLYALGFKPDDMERMFSGGDWTEVFSNTPDVSLNPLLARAKARYQGEINFKGLEPELPTGLLAGQRLTELLDEITTDGMRAAGFDFDRLPIPFRAVATDLVSGRKYLFQNGSMSEAIRASTAVPFLFAPVEKGPMLLADGGLVDNLPTDVARDLGADLVIAVDVTSPLLEKEQLKTFLEIIDQSIGLGMRRSVLDNRKLADLTLQPDLAHYSAADYTRIRENVQLGVAEAERRMADLKALLAQVPARRTLPVAARPAIATIASIAFEGLKEVSERQVREEVKARVGDKLEVAILAGDLRRLHATGLFDFADYTLTPAAPGSYHLVFTLHEAAMRTLGAAIRFDRDYGFIALAELNAWQILHTPSRLMLSSQFGGLDHDSARLHIVPSHRLSYFFISPEVHYSQREHGNYRDGEFVDEFTEKRIGSQLMLGTSFRRIEVEIGYVTDRITTHKNVPAGMQKEPLQLGGIRLNLNRNTFDSQKIPGRGSLLSLRFDNRFPSWGSHASFTRYEIDFVRHFPITPRSNLQLQGAVGHSRGTMPLEERFYLGGFNFSDGGAHRLLGFAFDELTARQMWIAAAAYRYRWFSQPLGFARSGFIAGYYNAAGISSREKSPYDFLIRHGGGAELSLITLIGPLRLAAGWGEGGRFNFHLTFGPSF